ncbi:tetratricopeptide repeat protein, partial [Saccharothrix longispora]|uniref:tetratricopeptide repeat protein n=1 Tax=Saccharothrix longispora TaxID=33920 RepID=UPI0028FDAC46
LLVILDNAADAAQVEPLLPGEGRCLVLVTSRRRLVELDAVSIDLDPLTPEEAERMFRELAGRDVDDPPALGRVVELCGRLPLALAILATRFRNRRTLTVARLAEELAEAGNRLSTLRARDRAVAAAFELSYRDLPPDRQRFFRLLGLHPGDGIERYAAAALTGIGVTEADDHLDALYHEHLLDEFVLGRFAMHDLLAEYALELASADGPGTLAAAVDALHDFYEQTAGIAGDLLVHNSRGEDVGTWFTGPVPPLGDADAAFAWLSAERGNLLSCLASTRDPGRIVGLTLSLAPYLRRTGPWSLTVALHRAAAEAARSLADRDAEARVLLELGRAEYYADNYDEAQIALRAADRLFEAAGDDTGRAQALTSLGQVWVLTGAHPDARDAFTRALAVHERAGDRGETAAVLVELGILHYFADEYPEAIAADERALRIFEALEDRSGQAKAHKGLGLAWLLSDDYARAETASARALELFRETGERLGEAQASSNLGSVRRARGQYARAREDLENALEIYDELDDRGGRAMALIELGIVLHHLGDFRAGERTLREALALYEEFGEPMGMAAVRKELADLLTGAGRLPEARELLDDAEALYQKLDDRMGKAATSNSYGAWHLASGDPRTARAHHAEALRLALEIASPLEQASAWTGLGRVARALGEHRAAEEAFDKALEIYRRIGSGEAETLAAEAGRG